MKAEIHYRGQSWHIDYGVVWDLSIPVQAQGVQAWGVGPAQVEPYRVDGQAMTVEQGSGVNFFALHFSPHAHGTHTETLGHLRAEWDSVNRVLPYFRGPARVITVAPDGPAGQHAIHILPDSAFHDGPEALLIRSLPNAASKRSANYSGTNPPYLAEAAMRQLVAEGVQHLLVDLPSVDPERDGGALAAHRAFWGLEPGVEPRLGATITELIYVPSEVDDGLYWLELQVAPVECDAAPSRPLLYPLIAVGG